MFILIFNYSNECVQEYYYLFNAGIDVNNNFRSFLVSKEGSNLRDE